LVDFGGWVDGVWEGKLAWIRIQFEWEKVLESQLLQKLQGLRIELEMEDSWV